MRYLEHALAHGIARHRAGHFNEARSVYESLLSLSMDPKICAVALANLSELHTHASRWPEARMAAEEALQIDPQNGVAITTTVRCDRMQGRARQALSRLTSWPSYSLPPGLIHEMALCYEAVGEHTKAYHSFREANRRSSFDDLDVDRSLVTRYIERMLEVHQCPDAGEAHPAPPMDQPSPLFIVGFNSDGGEELAKLLAKHSKLAWSGNIAALDAARTSLNGRDLEPLGRLRPKDIQRAREAYFAATAKRMNQGQRIVDSVPLNILSLPLIHRLFPESGIIRMVRHPVETVFQAFRTVHGVNAVTCHLDSMSRCAQFYLAVNAMGDHYRDTLGIPMSEIAYEEFTLCPQTYASAIAESLGLAWEEVPGHTPASPRDHWPLYKKVIAPWTQELIRMADRLGYPAK